MYIIRSSSLQFLGENIKKRIQVQLLYGLTSANICHLVRVHHINKWLYRQTYKLEWNTKVGLGTIQRKNQEVYRYRFR